VAHPLSELATKLVELGYCDRARVSKRFDGEAIYIGMDRYLDSRDAARIVKALEKSA